MTGALKTVLVTGAAQGLGLTAASLLSGDYRVTDIIDRVPMARFARPEDVAEAIAFLLDANRSAFINGISLPVDGGWTADASWNSLRLSTRS
jgi:NAD(P)-dependent dehydrogenase (short-subunit alcohol dehydrogenase family)